MEQDNEHCYMILRAHTLSLCIPAWNDIILSRAAGYHGWVITVRMRTHSVRSFESCGKHVTERVLDPLSDNHSLFSLEHTHIDKGLWNEQPPPSWAERIRNHPTHGWYLYWYRGVQEAVKDPDRSWKPLIMGPGVEREWDRGGWWRKGRDHRRDCP